MCVALEGVCVCECLNLCDMFVYLCIFVYECGCGMYEHLWMTGVCTCYVCVTFPVALSRAPSLGDPRFLCQNPLPTQYKEPQNPRELHLISEPEGRSA